MKPQSNSTFKAIVLVCSLTLFLFAGRAGAQLTTNTYICTNNTTASPGTNWNGTGVAAYWKLNGGGTAVQPFAGTATGTATNFNFFILNSNGIALGNGTATTLIRDPYTAFSGGPPFNYVSLATFPGDSLILNTNTQIRFKHSTNYTASGSLVSGVPFNYTTNNFPGNFGQPGLVMNGGLLSAGDSGSGPLLTPTTTGNF